MIESSPTSFLDFQLKKWSKRFYHSFKAERVAFLQALTGLSPTLSRTTATQTYGQLLLQRILVLYFLQAHGLLDQDPHYLAHLLQRYTQSTTEPASTFYHDCFLPLCASLYTGQRSDAHVYIRLGYIPHLAHPLFQPQPSEQTPQCLSIPDCAFSRLFTFLDTFNWQLTPPREGQTQSVQATAPLLTTHVLAYLYEQYSDQKQTGTYYTQSDIALYIASQTIIPALLTRVACEQPTLFSPTAALWHLLQENPSRYLSAALRTEERLPEEDAYEYQARRTRYRDSVAHLQAGACHDLTALTTNNLDILRFADDLITTCTQPELLLSFATQLEQVTILDPTCGSGAFLYASIMVLQPLYARCLQRLFDDPSLQKAAQAQPSPAWSQRYRSLHQRCTQAPSRAYFILQTILCQNLYGVDLQDEAVNLCQLLLYLQLLGEVTQVTAVPQFNTLTLHIYVGNALTPSTIPADPLAAPTEFQWHTAFPDVYQNGGFAVILGNPPYLEYSKVKHSYVIAGYEEKSCGNIYTAVIERSLELCQPEQSYLGLIVPISLCGSTRFQRVRQHLLQRTDTLWLANFEIFPSRLFEHAFQRLSILLARSAHHSPARVPAESASSHLFVTRIHRWYAAERAHLMQLLTYTPVTTLQTRPTSRTAQVIFPKLTSPRQEALLAKLPLYAGPHRLADQLQDQPGPFFIYYQEATNYWTKAVCHIPYYKKNDVVMRPTHGRCLYFAQEQQARTIMALLNSSLFYLWFATYADGFHLSHALVQNFPLPPAIVASTELYALALRLEEDITRNIRISTRNTRTTSSSDRHRIELAEYHMRYSKPLLDEIDHWLAHFYAFSSAEENFIINYDLKHRMTKNPL